MRKSTLTIAIRRTRALVYFRKPKLFNIFIISLSDQSDVKFHATFVSSDPLTEQIQMKNAFDNVMSLRIFCQNNHAHVLFCHQRRAARYRA